MNWHRFFRRGKEDAEQRAELDHYLDVTAQEFVDRGMDPDAARAAAHRKLGNTIQIREEVYRMNTVTFLESLVRDARHALRMIRTKPGFSVAVLLSLALGIGANTAIFSVLDAVLIRPLPYPGSDALVGVYNRLAIQRQDFDDADLSPGMYAACKESCRVFENFGVWSPGASTVTGSGEPEQVVALTATQGVLPALGVSAHLGRWFSNEDDSPGSPETVILSYGYWQRKFGGDRDILGRNIVIDFVPHQVIGVMPKGFRLVDVAPDILLPQRFLKIPVGPEEFSYTGIARLKPGMTMALANQDVARVWKNRGETDSEFAKALEMLHIQPNLRPLKKDVVGDVGPVLGVLMGALGLVLLLVCANVANLVLVRAQSSQQEFAIRAALGAGWGRIARELLVESLTLGFAGGALGVALAYVGLRAMVARGPANLPRLDEISLDGTALAFALACSLGTSLLFGLAAVLRSGIPGRMQSARGATQGARQLRAQSMLVVTQVALAFVLLVASGLMIRSFLALRAVNPGFTHPEWIQTVRIAIPEALTPDPEQVLRTQSEILRAVSNIPGVMAAGFASGLPLEVEYHNGVPIDVEGQISATQLSPNRAIQRISPGVFAAQGTRLLAGRDFTWEDIRDKRRVVVVSENMARENWGTPANALLKRIRRGQDSPWFEVVGVVEDARADGMNQPAPATVYFRAGGRGATFAIRSERAGTEAFVRDVANAVHGVNPNVPLANVRTLNDVYRHSMARTSFTLVLLGIAGGMALILAIIGVYGVLAYAAAQRRREVSIRVALGAEPNALKWLFVRKGLLLNCVGAAGGLLLTIGLSRWISSLLFGVTPLDPLTYAAAGALVSAAAMAASYIPARRAASVDPMETLRGD
ncbi:MAG TPA: ABC transporter permease [Bryobacteraceae bacterium]|nr:ABC transporter permease [Bryobacteraceae bacterium]